MHWILCLNLRVSVQCLNLGCEHLVPQASLEVLDLVNTSVMS